MRFSLVCSLLLLPAVFAEDPTVGIHMPTACPGWERTANFHPDAIMFIGVNRTTNTIRYNLVTSGDWRVGLEKSNWKMDSTLKKHPEIEKNFMGGDLEWTFAIGFTFRDSNKKEIEKDIYYGYDPNKLHKDIKDEAPNNKAPVEDTKSMYQKHPFRFNKIEVTYKKKKIIDLSVPCLSKLPRAWISHPGIYKLVKDTEGNFYWENIYYWPRIGQKFT